MLPTSVSLQKTVDSLEELSQINMILHSVNGLSTSTLVSYTSLSSAGLPDAQNVTFLSGGLLGGTTGTEFANSINGLASVQVNFIVPLISQNASDDIAIGQTDPSSTYQIASVTAILKQHVLAMSTPKIKRNRIGIASIQDTGELNNLLAQSVANFRIAMTFQDMIQPSISAGQNVQFQPWMSAALAASFQLPLSRRRSSIKLLTALASLTKLVITWMVTSISKKKL